jgi:hypothetical protein
MSPDVNVKAVTSIVPLEEVIFRIMASLIDPLGEKSTSVLAYIVSGANNTVRIPILSDISIVNKPIFLIIPNLFIA